jgi:glutathione S-transferase
LIKLYRGPLSTNVERVALALAHKALEVESIEIDWDDRSPVEAVSGQSLVPVIQDDGGDGEVVYDSATILRYLEERYPEPPLFASDPARRAEMDVFIDWFNEVWKYSPNTIEEELEKGSPDAAVIERHSALMVERMGLFERLLEGRDHLMGSEVSAADFVAFPFLKYALFPKLPEDDEPFHLVLDEYQPLGDDHPRLKAWIERIDALPRA